MCKCEKLLIILIFCLFHTHSFLQGQIKSDFILSENGHHPKILIDHQNQMHIIWSGDSPNPLYHCILDSIGNQILQPQPFANGRFLNISRSDNFISITWQTLPNPFGDPDDIYVRIMTNDGDSITEYLKVGTGGGANVTFLTDSTLLVTWVTYSQYDNSESIMGQKVKISSAFIGPNYQVTEMISDREILSIPDIDNSYMGENIVVVWCENQTSSTSVIMGRMLLKTGEPKDSTFQISEKMATNENSYPSVAVRKQGQFTVAWSEMDENSVWMINTRRYDENGIPLGEMETINKTNVLPYSQVDISTNEDGECIVVWEGKRDRKSIIMAQRLNENGTCLGNNFYVSTSNDTNDQFWPSVFLQDDIICTVWEEIWVSGGTTIESKIWANIHDFNDNSLDVEDDHLPIVTQCINLFPNFPNPFNNTTQIQYKLYHPCKITIKIYNILGEQIKVLINRDQSPGIYQVFWNGKDSREEDIPSGIYYVELRTVNEVETKKMILIH